MNYNKYISNSIQVLYQEFDEIVMNIPKSRVAIESIIGELFKIRIYYGTGIGRGTAFVACGLQCMRCMLIVA